MRGKRLFTLALVLLISSMLFAASWQDKSDTSWYTPGRKVYQIRSAEELAGLSELVNSGVSFRGARIVLTRDINLFGRTWVPIGTLEHPFEGSFNGSEMEIRDLEIDLEGENSQNIDPARSYLGLFGVVSGNTQIVNVEMKNVKITGDSYVGALVGYLDENSSLTLDDIELDGLVSMFISTNAGGILGSAAERSSLYFNDIDVDPNGFSQIQNGGANYTGDNLGGVVGSFYGESARVSNISVEKIELYGISEGVGGIFGVLGGAVDLREIEVEDLYLSINQGYGERAMSIGAISGVVLPGSTVNVSSIDTEKVYLTIPIANRNIALNMRGYFGTTGESGNYSSPSSLVKGTLKINSKITKVTTDYEVPITNENFNFE